MLYTDYFETYKNVADNLEDDFKRVLKLKSLVKDNVVKYSLAF